MNNNSNTFTSKTRFRFCLITFFMAVLFLLPVLRTYSQTKFELGLCEGIGFLNYESSESDITIQGMVLDGFVGYRFSKIGFGAVLSFGVMFPQTIYEAESGYELSEYFYAPDGYSMGQWFLRAGVSWKLCLSKIPLDFSIAALLGAEYFYMEGNTFDFRTIENNMLNLTVGARGNIKYKISDLYGIILRAELTANLFELMDDGADDSKLLSHQYFLGFSAEF